MTITFFVQLIITVIGYIALALSYLGIGWFCSRILRIGSLFENKFFSLVWIGWAITLFLLQILNLFIPINIYSSIPIFIFGLISAIYYFRMEFRNGTISSLSRIYLFLLIVAGVWIAILSMKTPTVYDSGLYHFNSIRWLNEFPIVLGLGNLHGRLAFNQSFFAYVAYLNLYPLFNYGHNVANSFLLLTLLAECLLYLTKYITPKNRIGNFSIINVVPILVIPTIIYLALSSSLSSPTPDIASSILQILLFIYFVRTMDEHPSTPNQTSQIIVILIISAITITIKLSNLFYVLSISIILILINLRSSYQFPRQIPRIVIKLLVLPALIIFIWGVRGMLLSGCPAYPSTIGCIHVHWSIPIENVQNMSDWVYSWARTPGQTPDKVLNSWNWLPPKLLRGILGNPRNILIVIYPLLFFGTGIMLSFIFYVRHSLHHKEGAKWFLVPIPTLIGFLFWFITAPSVRLANSLFWIAPITASVILLKFIEASGKPKHGIIPILFLILNANIAILFILNLQGFTSISAKGYMPLPVVNLTENTTLTGLKVLSPTEGDRCWDSKIPCTPYFNAKLNFMENKIFPEFTIVDTIK